MGAFCSRDKRISLSASIGNVRSVFSETLPRGILLFPWDISSHSFCGVLLFLLRVCACFSGFFSDFFSFSHCAYSLSKSLSVFRNSSTICAICFSPETRRAMSDDSMWAFTAAHISMALFSFCSSWIRNCCFFCSLGSVSLISRFCRIAVWYSFLVFWKAFVFFTVSF